VHQRTSMSDRSVNSGEGSRAEKTASARPIATRPKLKRYASALRHRISFRALSLLLVVGIFGYIAWLVVRWNDWFTETNNPGTGDAYISGAYTPLSIQVSGYVRAVPVNDNAFIQAGTIIARIEDDNYKASLAQAQAQLAQAKALVSQAEQQISLAEAQLASLQDILRSVEPNLWDANIELERQRKLLPTTVGLPEAYQQAQANAGRLQASRVAAQANIEAQARTVKVLHLQLTQGQSQVQEAIAAEHLAQITLGWTVLTAPIDGLLGQRQVFVGSYASPGTLIDTIAPVQGLWIVANFLDTQMEHLRIGQRVDISVDAFPKVRAKGRVAGISPAAGVAMAPASPDNTTGNFTKVVALIPVKITILDESLFQNRLRIGMSAYVRVHTETGS
jgi:membrane fusion protein (multidrug efflux system)